MPENVLSMMLFGQILICSLENYTVKIINVVTRLSVNTLHLAYKGKILLHPKTYLNKVLVIGNQNQELWNVNSGQQIYDFQSETSFNQLLKASIYIKCACNSPVVDIISLGFSNGLIVLYNIKSAELVMNFKQDTSVLAMDFNVNINFPPVLVTSDARGRLYQWSLNDKKLVNVIEDGHVGAVPFVRFLEADQDELFQSGGIEENSVKMWVRDDEQSNNFRVLRFRGGASETLKSVKFYGQDGQHVIAHTGNSSAEIIDFSVIREEITGKLSQVIFFCF